MSSLGFKARVGNLIFGGGVCVTYSLRFTSGVTPANLLSASITAELISSTYLQAGIGRARTLYRLDETFFCRLPSVSLNAALYFLRT